MCISQITFHSASKQIRLESFWCTTIDSRLSRAVDVHANYFSGFVGVVRWNWLSLELKSSFRCLKIELLSWKSFQLETIEEKVYLHSRKFAVKLLVRSWCAAGAHPPGDLPLSLSSCETFNLEN